jgi:hypothetical protein
MRNAVLAVAALALCGCQSMGDTHMTSATAGAPIVFFDIAGPDAAKLKEFYAGNFGWSIDRNNLIKAGSLDGALRQDPPEKIVYIGVPDLDAVIAKVNASGGKVITPKIPIPTGTFALFTDPAGNRMGLVQLK